MFSRYYLSDSLLKKSQRANFSCLKFNNQELTHLSSRLVEHLWSVFQAESDLDSLFDLFHHSLKEIILDTCDVSQSNLT